MTTLQDLPCKLSDLILVAIADLAKVERSKKYEVDMNLWHEPGTVWGRVGFSICYVCLAGAVMAISLKTAMARYSTPSSYPEYVEVRLSALNNILNGDVYKALRRLGNLDAGIPEDLRSLFIMPVYGPSDAEKRAFKAGLRRIVRALQKHGL